MRIASPYFIDTIDANAGHAGKNAAYALAI